ncbi:hypothetical protein MBLNU230_g0185t1 [Neophaeotheca triangularis]
MAADLTPAQCVLLTVHFASNADIKSLHSFTPLRLDALDPELVLRILLTYLPGSLDPSSYTNYVGEVASRLYLDVDRENVEVDISPVKDVADEQAQKKVKKLHLLQIDPPAFPPHAPKDLLARWLIHRAHRIDAETGMLHLVPELVEPFLERSYYLRTWYISVCLPMLRRNYEFYPDSENDLAIGDFEAMEGNEGIDFLLAHNVEDTAASGKHTLGRDLKSLCGPWIYGHTERKRRKLGLENKDEPQEASVDGISRGMKKIGLDGVTGEDKTGHDWEHAYKWLVKRAAHDFQAVASAIEDWDGPGDVDLGGYDVAENYLDEELQRKLELQYGQTAFAACYAVTADTEQTVKDAHNILARLAELLDFVPPPDLATSVDSLPKIERQATVLEKSEDVSLLAPHVLLRPEHPLTSPRLESYMLLQMIVYSAYQFNGLGHPSSLVGVAKLQFYSTAEEQLATLKKMLRSVAGSGANNRRDESQWIADRAKLLWLWNWGIDTNDETARNGAGVLGKIDREDFEEEMLKVFVDTSCYNLAINLNLNVENEDPRRLPAERVKEVTLAKAMEAYDGASNGNRTRGGMKKANDIVAAFRPYFKNDPGYRKAISLISATHALSFYSLTLQHGVPFQPVNLRASQDPLGLLNKVLEQNSRSYTKLDDLVEIGGNLVSAGLPNTTFEDADDRDAPSEESKEEQAKARKDAERKVVLMAIEAALREDDFETAYSYIVNRLTPSGPQIAAPDHKPGNLSKRKTEDDISWRAAFLAGRYRGSPTSSPPTVRRLEQRTELLSLALLLAPTSALSEILSVWRRCEEETTALQASQAEAEEDFDDRADKRQSGLPGNFVVDRSDEGMVLGQKRREMGRLGGGGEGEAPMSMFDLTRSAARALSKNAFPLGQNTTSPTSTGRRESGFEGGMEGGVDEDGQRVRKRDMAFNAVSGGLASGLGWVLGATPVDQQRQAREGD